jgi:hypothetical protein
MKIQPAVLPALADTNVNKIIPLAILNTAMVARAERSKPLAGILPAARFSLSLFRNFQGGLRSCAV